LAHRLALLWLVIVFDCKGVNFVLIERRDIWLEADNCPFLILLPN
jgi:hypothetical protein